MVEVVEGGEKHELTMQSSSSNLLLMLSSWKPFVLQGILRIGVFGLQGNSMNLAARYFEDLSKGTDNDLSSGEIRGFGLQGISRI